MEHKIDDATYHRNHLDKLNEDDINYIIKQNKLDTNKISDGYHRFEELYDHRIQLFITLCRILDNTNACNCSEIWQIWKSKTHHDGSSYEGWFIMGIGKRTGEQISYHLPILKWDECDFADTLLIAPDWDGHKSDDVLQRLKNL